MNDKHKGPHCAGSCEGAAYLIKIRGLEAENAKLKERVLEGETYSKKSVAMVESMCFSAGVREEKKTSLILRKKNAKLEARVKELLTTLGKAAGINGNWWEDGK